MNLKYFQSGMPIQATAFFVRSKPSQQNQPEVQV